MMRTKAEIINFFEVRVGTRVDDKLNSDLNGQCVTLEKALLDYLGVPNPYKARGNAKDYGNRLISEGIAKSGKGWLNVIINPDMGVVKGVTYGHIWNDVAGNNYEQNGAKALRVTKNTRPISQGRQFLNLDQWIQEGGNMAISPEAQKLIDARDARIKLLEDQSVVSSADVINGYANLLGRKPSQAEIDARVKSRQNFKSMIYELWDSKERGAFVAKQAKDLADAKAGTDAGKKLAAIKEILK